MSAYKIIKEKIESQKANISEKDLRFFQFQRLIRIAQVIENDIKDCKHCNEKIEEVSLMLDDIKKLIEDRKSRIKLDRVSEQLVKHLRVEHKFYLPNYFSYTYSLLGMLLGVIIGVIIMSLNIFESRIVVVAASWSIGLLFGKAYGLLKDKSEKKKEKQL